MWTWVLLQFIEELLVNIIRLNCKHSVQKMLMSETCLVWITIWRITCLDWIRVQVGRKDRMLDSVPSAGESITNLMIILMVQHKALISLFQRLDKEGKRWHPKVSWNLRLNTVLARSIEDLACRDRTMYSTLWTTALTRQVTSIITHLQLIRLLILIILFMSRQLC